MTRAEVLAALAALLQVAALGCIGRFARARR